ncbi:hypothetical protein XENTR_v10022498 [Xenopus tropicalis]|nr:hypothetical protein XENTR_v10022498 [Xenopus tropicalis]
MMWLEKREMKRCQKMDIILRMLRNFILHFYLKHDNVSLPSLTVSIPNSICLLSTVSAPKICPQSSVHLLPITANPRLLS